MSYKPAGYTSVAPYLVVNGAQGTIDFLVAVFGAVPLRIQPRDDKVAHGEVRIDDTVVMLTDGAEGWPPIASNVHVYVKDVDATFQRAIAHGATSVQEPVQKGDDDKRGGFRDNGGTTWWVAQQVD